MRSHLLVRAIAMVGAAALITPLTGGIASAEEPQPLNPPVADPHHDGADHDGDPAPADPDPVPLTEETFTLGPFSLAPEGQPGDSFRRDFVEVPRPEGDIAIRSFEWELLDGNGDPVPAEAAHLHHVVLLEDSRRDSVCGIGGMPRNARFAGTGSELNDFEFPDSFAYHVPAEATWEGLYMVANTSDAPIDVSISYTVGYTDAAEEAFTHLDQYFLDVVGCWNEGNSAFDVPGDGGPGSIVERSRTYTMQRDGVMHFGGGHLHHGGIDVTLTGPDGIVCQSVATYHDEGGDHGDHGRMETSGCPHIGEEFKIGDEYTLTARYSNEHPVPAAMGIMGIYAHHTSPPPDVPPEPSVEVTIDGLDGAALVGTVACEPSDVVRIYGSVTQQVAELPVNGGGMAPATECGPEPVPFTIPISGNGILTEGTVEYWVDAWSEGSYAGAWVEGETTVQGRIDLGRTPPDRGPLPITIEGVGGKAETGPVAIGTVTCDEPDDLTVAVSGWQAAGRYHLPLTGSQQVACDGETSFEIPFDSWRGGLKPGPATITISAYSADWTDDGWGFPHEMPEASTRSERITLRNGTPEPDFSPEPDPDSPVTIGAVARVDDELWVGVTSAACDPGKHVYLNIEVRPTSVRLRDRWWNPQEFGQYGWLEEHEKGACSGKATTFILKVSDTFEGDEVAVYATRDVYSPDDWESDYTSNAATVTIETK